MEVKKKSIFKRILAFGGALLCAFAFCFGIVNISNNHKDTLQVSADEIISNGYEFNGSGLSSMITPVYPYTDGSFYVSSLLFLSIVSFGFGSIDGVNVDYISLNLTFDAYDGIYNNIYTDFDDFGIIHMSLLPYHHSSYSELFFSLYYTFYPVDGSDGKIMKKPIGFNYYSVQGIGDIEVYVEYFDADNNILEFRWYYKPFKVFDNISSNLSMEKRTYYFVDSLDISDNEYYNLGYNAGNTDGYNYGYDMGGSYGYAQGYGVGKNDGYNLGYNTAVGNDRYSFDSLLSAVIDVPVRTFTSLFNFEILGVNLSGFFLGLLTCCIVVAIVRFIL